MHMMLRTLAGCAMLGFALAAPAQNVVITNARIIDGTGNVIEHGSVVAKDGKIVAVASGEPRGGSAGPRLDAHGMTVLAGFIDAHRHIIRGNTAAWLKDHAAENMKSFVDAGFTTIFSMGDDPHGVLELRSQLASGAILGPRLYAVRIVPLSAPTPAPTGAAPHGPYTDPARTDPARPPDRPATAPPAIPDEQSRAAVRSAKEAGFDAIKTFMIVVPGGPESHTLAVIVDEAHKQGLRVFTHATAVPDALAAVNAHIDVLAHTPHIGHLEDDEAARQTLIDAHVPMVSTLAVFIPHFDAQNKPLFRDGGPFPMSRPLSSGGQGPVNARILWEGGLTYAYGTDTQWDPRDSLNDELRALNLVFSPRDILKIMGPNTAAAIGKSGELGTLEPGKDADMVMVDGDPLEDVFNLTRVVLVVKGGKVISDKRGQHPHAGER
jgi:imidazolonepropionase-like amidohydrolase